MPAIQTVHIVAIAAVFISAVMINLRLLALSSSDQPTATVVIRFGNVIWWALPFLLVTGLLLIIGEPARSLANDVFQIKMLLLLSVVLITFLLQRKLSLNKQFWESSKTRQLIACSLALISTGCWIAIICAGRWIAYTYT